MDAVTLSSFRCRGDYFKVQLSSPNDPCLACLLDTVWKGKTAATITIVEETPWTNPKQQQDYKAIYVYTFNSNYVNRLKSSKWLEQYGKLNLATGLQSSLTLLCLLFRNTS